MIMLNDQNKKYISNIIKQNLILIMKLNQGWKIKYFCNIKKIEDSKKDKKINLIKYIYLLLAIQIGVKLIFFKKYVKKNKYIIIT